MATQQLVQELKAAVDAFYMYALQEPTDESPYDEVSDLCLFHQFYLVLTGAAG